MKYKRESFFRYAFEEPLNALFQINSIDGTPVETAEGEAKIIDISPEGAKLTSILHIPETDHKSIELSISFELEGKELNFNGVIVWMKDKGADNDFGIKFSAEESTKNELVEILKLYSKNANHL